MPQRKPGCWFPMVPFTKASSMEKGLMFRGVGVGLPLAMTGGTRSRAGGDLWQGASSISANDSHRNGRFQIGKALPSGFRVSPRNPHSRFC